MPHGPMDRGTDQRVCRPLLLPTAELQIPGLHRQKGKAAVQAPAIPIRVFQQKESRLIHEKRIEELYDV
ncbi:hypothetical protein D3C75_561630 [compost metagenome]